nr:cuticle protein 7-like [Penaeus vannamei]
MKAAVVLCVVAAAWAAPQGGYNYQAPVVQQPEYPSVPAQYNFQWDVNDQNSGNFYGQQEQRDGDNTQGSYYVQLPDSRLMRVDYYSDASGFHPTVTFEGEGQYPSAPAQVYSQPARAPAQVYSQPVPAPAPYSAIFPACPSPCPGVLSACSALPLLLPPQFYSQPGK